MRIIRVDALRKEIHFPVARAVYRKPSKRNWFQRFWKFVTYRRGYETMQDYILYIPLLDKYLFVPSFFIYDNASVPKALNSFFNSDGMLLLGALPHDFGYRYEHLIFVNQLDGMLYLQKVDKKELDELFQYLCAYESGFNKASWVAEKTLSLVGVFAWNKRRKENADLNKDFPGLFAEIGENDV